MTAILLSSLVPIFAVMALGYFAGWVRDVDNRHVSELNALVMDFALPASLFVATATTPWTTLTAQSRLLLVLAITMLGLYVLSYWMQRRLFGLDPGVAAVQALTVSLPNYAAAGLPLIAAVFDPTRIIYVALAIAAGAIVVSPLTLAILEAHRPVPGDRRSVGLILGATGRSLRKPIVVAPIVGALWAITAIPLPDFVGQAFNLIGQAAGGVALFLTGLILSSQRLQLTPNVISGALLNNVAHPLAVAGLIMLLPMPDDAGRAAILLSALPSGFFGVLFGLRYGIKSGEAGSTLIVSSLSSAVTLPVVLVLTRGV